MGNGRATLRLWTGLFPVDTFYALLRNRQVTSAVERVRNAAELKKISFLCTCGVVYYGRQAQRSRSSNSSSEGHKVCSLK